MKLEYRVLELVNGDEQECSYCFIDYSDQTNLDFSTAPAAYQMVAHTKSEQYFDISFICKDCKLEYDNNVLPRCEKCDRLMRNKSLCYCHKEKKKQTQSLTNRELVAQSFSFRLESKTRELEKELSITKEELKVEREEIAKFQEKSEEWGKRQKQELLDKVKGLEERIKQLEEENSKLKDQQNGQIAQIEVKETKRWSWLKIRK